MIYKTIDDAHPEAMEFLIGVFRMYMNHETTPRCDDLPESLLAVVKSPAARQDLADTFNYINCGETDPAKSNDVIDDFSWMGDSGAMHVLLHLVTGTTPTS